MRCRGEGENSEVVVNTIFDNIHFFLHYHRDMDTFTSQLWQAGLGLCTVARPRRTDGTVCAGTVPGPVKKWTWIYQDLPYPPLAMAGTILARIFDGRIRVTYDPYGQL